MGMVVVGLALFSRLVLFVLRLLLIRLDGKQAGAFSVFLTLRCATGPAATALASLARGPSLPSASPGLRSVVVLSLLSAFRPSWPQFIRKGFF